MAQGPWPRAHGDVLAQAVGLAQANGLAQAIGLDHANGLAQAIGPWPGPRALAQGLALGQILP